MTKTSIHSCWNNPNVSVTACGIFVPSVIYFALKSDNQTSINENCQNSEPQMWTCAFQREYEVFGKKTNSSTFINLWITHESWTTGLTDIPSWNRSSHTSSINRFASFLSNNTSGMTIRSVDVPATLFDMYLGGTRFESGNGPSLYWMHPARTCACIDSNFKQSWPFANHPLIIVTDLNDGF
jgi:hypothetical protein